MCEMLIGVGPDCDLGEGDVPSVRSSLLCRPASVGSRLGIGGRVEGLAGEPDTPPEILLQQHPVQRSQDGCYTSDEPLDGARLRG